MSFLQINSVSKRFQDHLAVDNVSLSIAQGSIYGLLGPNGAGKTTIIRMITGIFEPDSGEILLDGEKLARRDISRIGYMPEERGLYKKTKVIEQITYLLRLKGLDRKKADKVAWEWLEKMGLQDWGKRLTSDLSKGMQQKVQFISTVAHEPDLLILDEPVSGLDPVNAKVMEQEILELKRKGKTIIFSTHRLEQVEEMCDGLALINKGKVLLENTLPEVKKQFQKNLFRLEYTGETDILAEIPEIHITDAQKGKVVFSIKETFSTAYLLKKLADLPIEVTAFVREVPKLNDIFIELVGETI